VRTTAEDLARWSIESEEHRTSGSATMTFNPDWAKALCWTMAEHADQCPMKPQLEKLEAAVAKVIGAKL